MNALPLKAVATCFTLLATAGAGVYVGGHVKNPSAPLHPSILGSSAAPRQAAGGKLSLAPSIRSSDVQAVTSTYPS
jgi:hypothetical protein